MAVKLGSDGLQSVANPLKKKKKKVESIFDPNTAEKVPNFQPKYSQYKGGNIDSATGKFIPPDPKTTTQINFKKDGTIDYTPIGGDTLTLSKEEYSALQGKEGIVTEKVRDIEFQESTEGKVAKSIAEQDAQVLQQQQKEQRRAEMEANRPIGYGEMAEQEREKLGRGAIGFIASAADIMRTAITGQKPKAVQKAEGTFRDASSIISQNIEAVKLNPSLYIEALQDFDRAQQAINLLEAQTKGKGRLNLNYWVDEGAELEASIENQRAVLTALRQDLEAARVQGFTANLR